MACRGTAFKDFIHFFQKKKGDPKTKSESTSKPPTGAKILWRGTRKIRGALKNILRNRSFLQCCPIAIYRDRPLAKHQQTVTTTSSDHQSSDDVSREHKEIHALFTAGMEKTYTSLHFVRMSYCLNGYRGICKNYYMTRSSK
jgi:hypothetical protein